MNVFTKLCADINLFLYLNIVLIDFMEFNFVKFLIWLLNERSCGCSELGQSALSEELTYRCNMLSDGAEQPDLSEGVSTMLLLVLIYVPIRHCGSTQSLNQLSDSDNAVI